MPRTRVAGKAVGPGTGLLCVRGVARGGKGQRGKIGQQIESLFSVSPG